MKTASKRITVAVKIAVLVCGLPGILRAQRPVDPWSFVEDSVRAEQLDTVVRLRIALPFEYSPEKPPRDSFPVLIVLGASDRFLYSSLVTSLRLLNTPFGGAVPPLIIIGVASNPTSPWPKTTTAMDSLRPGAGGAEAFTHFLSTDLIPWINARFPARSHITIAGHSVYGVLSLYAFAQSRVFDAAIAVSPAFWWLSASVNDRKFAESLANRIGRDPHRRIYVVAGAFDPEPIRKGTKLFDDAMKKISTQQNLKYEVLSDDNHQTSRERGFVEGSRWVFRPVSLAQNDVYAQMGGFTRDLDTLALNKAYERIKARYAEGARSMNLPSPLPANFLAAALRLSPIDNRNAPIPIFRRICADYSHWYPNKQLPTPCSSQ